MATVYLSSPTNSITFTTCCDVAVIEEAVCPRCRQEVVPTSRSERWQRAFEQAKRGYGNYFPNHGEGREPGRRIVEALNARRKEPGA